LPGRAEGASEFERVFRLRENLYEAWAEFAGLLWARRLAPPVILQLVQLRVRQLHGAQLGAQRMSEAVEEGWDETRVAELGEWWKSARFSETERACLRLAEQFVLDAKGIGEAEIAPVRTALGDAAVVALVEALAIFDGFTRFQKMLGIADAQAPSPPSRRREPRVVTRPSLRIAPPKPLGTDAISGSALAHQPEALAAFLKLYGTLWSRGLLDHAVKEMARIRSARTVDCGY
jgi:alkylhydroperoxidase family enzyme